MSRWIVCLLAVVIAVGVAASCTVDVDLAPDRGLPDAAVGLPDAAADIADAGAGLPDAELEFDAGQP